MNEDLETRFIIFSLFSDALLFYFSTVLSFLVLLEHEFVLFRRRLGHREGEEQASAGGDGDDPS